MRPRPPVSDVPFARYRRGYDAWARQSVGALLHAWYMRVFISSVRRGLERERDALPGLITAIGHEALRFEDFGARAEPSREACLAGVASADVYLLILGPIYGHRFPETNQSPTHDEWVAATTKGMPRLVFRKIGVDFEEDQEEFARLVGNYSDGVFYDQFETPEDLQTRVAAAVLRLANAPSPLAFEPLTQAPTISWHDEWSDRPRNGNHEPAFIELHVAPLESGRIPARRLKQASGQLINGLRQSGAVSAAAGLDVSEEPDATVVEVPPPDGRIGGWNQPRPGTLSGVRLSADGQISLWATLPSDGMGAMVDPANLTTQLSEMLRCIDIMNVHAPGRFAIAIGIGGSTLLVSLATVSGMNRSSASMGMGRDRPIRVLPDESVSESAFGGGANEVAHLLTSALVDEFRRRR